VSVRTTFRFASTARAARLDGRRGEGGSDATPVTTSGRPARRVTRTSATSRRVVTRPPVSSRCSTTAMTLARDAVRPPYWG
jgi:hypothetical protein